MALNPDIRASDGDRDRVVEALREHVVAGRITADEFNERLEHTYQARTLGELQVLTADLPEHDPYQLPIPAAQRSSSAPVPRRPREVRRRGAGAVWAPWAAVSGICFLIWLIATIGAVVSGHGLIFPWFLWVAGPWAAVNLIGQFRGPRR